MKIIERGVKKPKYPWVGRYLCPYCDSVLELTEDDASVVRDADEDQRQGWSLKAPCPVCEQIRSLMDCDGVVGRCGGRGM